MAKHRFKHTRIYDKRRPEGKQDVAHLVSCIADDGEPQILFSGQQYEGGVLFLNKQHAVEFASYMLMMALQLPGDIPEGDCLFSDDDASRPEGRCHFMPHSKHTIPQPHPENAARTHTVVLNTDCPRCGGSLGGLGLEPEDLLHCPHCKGALEACARIEDGDEDRTKDIVTIAWLQPSRLWRMAGPRCDCLGCTHSRPEGSR